MKESPESREAKWGERMIEIKVRFWTDEIVKGEGRIKPKHAWCGGVIRMERNKAHEIAPTSPRPFNSLMEIPSIMEKVLIEHGITLHHGSKMSKYMER